MEICEESVHINGIPKRLVVFLHGYIDSAFSLEERLAPFFESLDNTAFHMPQAPLECEIHEKKRQWYSIHRFDPDDERKTVQDFETCVSIYDKMKPGIIEASSALERYIDNCVSEYGIDYKDVFICGFSQGGTLAIYQALMTEEKIGGCVVFSSIIAPAKYLKEHHKSCPPFLLIHGTDDNIVRFLAFEYTKKELDLIGCKTKTYVVEGGRHTITPDGLQEAAKFIKSFS